MVPFYIIFFLFPSLSLYLSISLSPEESKGVKDFGRGVKKKRRKSEKVYNRTGVR